MQRRRLGARVRVQRLAHHLRVGLGVAVGARSARRRATGARASTSPRCRRAARRRAAASCRRRARCGPRGPPCARRRSATRARRPRSCATRLGVGERPRHARHGAASPPRRVQRLGRERAPLVGADDVQRGVDEREVRERLREVAEVAARDAGRSPRRRAAAARRSDSSRSHSSRARRCSPISLSARHEPERADRERRPPPRAEPVVGLVDAVAQDEPVDGQLVGDRVDGRDDARVVGRQEAHERRQQQRRVERVGAVVLDEARRARRRRARARRPGSRPPRPASAANRSASSRSRASRAPRSHATQHMIFDDVKCCGSPRTSQMPRSGSRQCVDRLLDLLDQDRPEATRAARRATSCAGRTSRGSVPQTSCWRWL